MRPIKQVINSKIKNSKFFETFIKKYGDIATRGASDDDIFKSLKTLYIDFSSGSVQQDKYIQYFYSDPRILNLVLQDTYSKLMSAHIIHESLQLAKSTNASITTLPQFVETFEDCRKRYNTYSLIYNCVQNFINTGQTAYLVQISVNLNNPVNRDERGQVVL